MDQHTDFFTLLGLDADNGFDEAELKAAYRKAARESHPDAGGSEARFQAVQEAYENLKDPDRRRLYTAEHTLREVRNQLPKRYIPESDYLPYVLSVLDPGGRHRDGPVRAATTAQADDGAGEPHTGGDAGDSEPRRRKAYEDDFDLDARRRDRAAAEARTEAGRTVKEEVARRLVALMTVPLRWRALGLVAGMVVGWAGVQLWDLGVLATVLTVEAGDRLWIRDVYNPDVAHTPSSRSGWMFMCGLVGWQTAKRLGAVRRKYRVNDRVLATIAAAVVGLLWASPMLVREWTALVAVAVTVAVADRVWMRRKDARFLDTDAARDLGLRFDRSGPRPSVELDQRLIDEIERDAHAYWSEKVG